MDKLPRELVEAILQEAITTYSKNDAIRLRLVCKEFEFYLKPYICKTLGLDFTRLSKSSNYSCPEPDALQTIGYHCKSFYIDLMILRDESEVEFLQTLAQAPTMANFCQLLLRKYCMNPSSFTELEYYNCVQSMLFNCREVKSLRLNLPFQLVGRMSTAATMVLANTFKAFASRPEEDSAELNILVIENMTDTSICQLWTNPVDVANIIKVIAPLEHLIITLRKYQNTFDGLRLFGACLWNMVEQVKSLKSFCITGMDNEERPPRSVKQTRFWQQDIEEWHTRVITVPLKVRSNLTCLELKRIEIEPSMFSHLVRNFGFTLEQLFLNEVTMQVQQGATLNRDTKQILWVGLPNMPPSEDSCWIAPFLRQTLPKLRICRASFLAYHLFVWIEGENEAQFDLDDPCRIGRSISQRFVEVVMGVKQPDGPDGVSMTYYPCDDKDLGDRGPMNIIDYDANAYQMAVDNTTSHWQRSIDGVFPNVNSNTIDELHFIAETACRGMNESQAARTWRNQLDS